MIVYRFQLTQCFSGLAQALLTGATTGCAKGMEEREGNKNFSIGDTAMQPSEVLIDEVSREMVKEDTGFRFQGIEVTGMPALET